MGKLEMGKVALVRMKSSLSRPCFSSRTRRLAVCLVLGLALYVFSTGPVAWATNDAFHPACLPDWVLVTYMPLVPLMKIGWVGSAFEWWTANVWGGCPDGYTTL